MSLIEALGIASMLFVAAFTFRAYLSADADGGAQSKRAAIIEAWTNIVIGFSINFVANLLIIPLMTGGHASTLGGNFWGGWLYTAISIVRQYAVRRWFNAPAFAARLASLIGR